MSVGNSTVFLNSSKCFIYSIEIDVEFVKHLKQCEQECPKFNLKYSIGNVCNCPLKDIFSSDEKHNSVFKLSYTYLPYYTKIEGSFLWCKPEYKVTRYENKFIAVDVNLDLEEINHLLRILIPPILNDKIDSVIPIAEIKNNANCLNRKTIYLK